MFWTAVCLFCAAMFACIIKFGHDMDYVDESCDRILKKISINDKGDQMKPKGKLDKINSLLLKHYGDKADLIKCIQDIIKSK